MRRPQILNFGSINVDLVYNVPHFVRPGETLNSDAYQIFAGGKGFNQSIALARAGANVQHAGMIGTDGQWLLDRLKKEGVEPTSTRISDDFPTGHAIIQVDPAGENSILLHGGANMELSAADLNDALDQCETADYLLLQNEINCVGDSIIEGKRRGLQVVFNPAPFTSNVHDFPLEEVDLFIMNEIEAEGLCGSSAPEEVHATISRCYPHAAAVLTRGSEGAYYFNAQTEHHEPAVPVEAVDTTAAGDTFIGFFLAELIRSGNYNAALELGCQAAARCVTKLGAADSIPHRNDL